MKIAIDGYELNRSYTGVGRYLYNLLREILSIDKDNQYQLYVTEELPLKLDAPNLKVSDIGSNSHTKWQNSNLYKALKTDKPDLFFSPNHSLPLFWKGPSVMTVHDVSWRVVKQDFSAKERIIRDLKTYLALKKASKVFTVSEFSKDETVKFYKADPSKVIAIHSGIEDTFRRSRDRDIDEFRTKYGIGDMPAIGFLGSMFPRRHVKELIEAWQKIRTGFPCKLILCGKNFCGNEIDQICSSEADIIRIDRIEENELNTFYSSLDIFAYLSSYEGFGFPPMEALQCGTVPLLLNSSSLGEIYPGIAVFSATPSSEDIAESLKRFFQNSEGIKLSIMEQWAQKRRNFTWNRAAGEYLKHMKL